MVDGLLAIIEAASAAIISVDSDQRIVLFNRKYSAMAW
jgi:PAS domain-containing protein